MDHNKEHLIDFLATSSIILTEGCTPEQLEVVAAKNRWRKHPVWLAYATRLDESPIMYFLPDQYWSLVLLTDAFFPYVKACTDNGAIPMYIVGTCAGDQPLGPFWDETCEANFITRKYLMSKCSVRMFSFGRAVQVSNSTTLSQK